jgi:hypothetical protein
MNSRRETATHNFYYAFVFVTQKLFTTARKDVAICDRHTRDAQAKEEPVSARHEGLSLDFLRRWPLLLSIYPLSFFLPASSLFYTQPQ